MREIFRIFRYYSRLTRVRWQVWETILSSSENHSIICTSGEHDATVIAIVWKKNSSHSEQTEIYERLGCKFSKRFTREKCEGSTLKHVHKCHKYYASLTLKTAKQRKLYSRFSSLSH